MAAVGFFDRQDNARRQTRRLLVMFAAAVAIVILAIYLVVALAAATQAKSDSAGDGGGSLWNPALLACISLGTIAVVGLASLYKIAELSAGGEKVALMMGGRLVQSQTTDLAERRLLNVVEEMALASGVHVPPVYVLDREPGINAFAAGHQPGDAVVAVSRGCLEYLNREELQGVLGHEFSHILNGDMRLNLRLIGVVYGILVLSILGYYIMRFSGGASSRNSRDGGAGAAMLLVGLAMLIFGYLGVFLGKIIKSAISRQREFLADASSVQFTRNPGGIAGALKKIGGLAQGSRIRDAHAEEISHMFFGDAFAGSLLNLFATHPPLVARIRALDAGFDGRFPAVLPLAAVAEAVEERPAQAAAQVMGLDAGTMAARVGRPQAEHIDHAARLVAAIPQPLLDAAREPALAQAVVFALLLSRDDEAVRAQQLQTLQDAIQPALLEQVRRLAAPALAIAAAARLPLVDLTVPALKQASPQQYGRFRDAVETLVNAEHQVDLFEYCVRIVLFASLDVHFGLKKPPPVRYRSLASARVRVPASIVLTTLAYAGRSGAEDVQRAFQAGAEAMGVQLLLAPPKHRTLQAFGVALSELAHAVPAVKRAAIAAATACIAADGKATLEENELLRAIAAALACPIPPILQ